MIAKPELPRRGVRCRLSKTEVVKRAQSLLHRNEKKLTLLLFFSMQTLAVSKPLCGAMNSVTSSKSRDLAELPHGCVDRGKARHGKAMAAACVPGDEPFAAHAATFFFPK